ncbi:MULTISPECIES: hypothetical protein [unclassified Snodgrassella]|uniref:hypothetical protein n=1 Tax=unclassified Snodgrassella TaxID=2625236 RepID=UPI0018DC74D5|nr:MULTISPECIES: hypothetical protein [unclassified Snodgrassella]MBI0159621.1 hypothetical protein [Snodgrassella sp. W6238H11]MBI0161836.1 hypothetical protein [Snodgrassella sp. W6238H14]
MEQNIAYLDTALGILWAGDIGTAVLETVGLHADYAKNAARHITRRTSLQSYLFGSGCKVSV